MIEVVNSFSPSLQISYIRRISILIPLLVKSGALFETKYVPPALALEITSHETNGLLFNNELSKP